MAHESHILRGAARLLDLGGQLGYDIGDWYEVYEYRDLLPEVADALAMHSDWATTGTDLRRAMAIMDRLVVEARHADSQVRDALEELLRESRTIEELRADIARLDSSPEHQDKGDQRQMTLFGEKFDPARESR